jgi:hypothetical protein
MNGRSCVCRPGLGGQRECGAGEWLFAIGGLVLAEPQELTLARRLHIERLRAEGADRLAAASARGDQARGTQPAQVPAHQRLRQADVLDEIPDGGRAAGEAPDDAQAVDVGERLVEQPQLAKVIGLVDDGRERRADPGG